MSRDEVRDLLERCLKVLFYRDCRALNKVGRDGPALFGGRGWGEGKGRTRGIMSGERERERVSEEKLHWLL